MYGEQSYGVTVQIGGLQPPSPPLSAAYEYTYPCYLLLGLLSSCYYCCFVVAYCKTLALPVSQERIYVTEGESFNFSCGPPIDPLEGTTTTLNNNEPSVGIVTQIGISENITFYHYRNTTFEDNNTRIVCTAGQDVGVIYLTVFCK